MIQKSIGKRLTTYLLFTWLITGGLFLHSLAAQQLRLGVGRQNSSPMAVFLPAPRELQRELNRAVENIKNEEYVDAVTRLHYILNGAEGDDSASEDFFLPAQAGKPRVSLKQQADRLLSRLPKNGRAAYELAYGTDAGLLLKQAIAARDYDAIRDVSRRFGNSDAGEEATLLLGRWHLSNGNALEAYLHFQRLAESEHASKRFGEELTVLRAAALKLGNRGDEAQTLLAEQAFDSNGPIARLFSNGGVDQWLASISRSGGSVSGLTDWLMLGGNANRSATSEASLPTRDFLWPFENAIPQPDQEKLQNLVKAQGATGLTPVIHPLLVGDLVISRSADFVWAAPLRGGKCQFYYPGANLDATNRTGVARREIEMKQQIWNNALYGQVSSDGDLLYLISTAPEALNASSMAISVSNELVALELSSEGKLMWIVGGDQQFDEPALRGMFFLGAPLPLGGSVFCLGERNGEIRVMEIDKGTGKLLWSQQIAHLDGSPRAQRPAARRMAGLNLAYADGVLVCPTSTGGVVGIELAQRRLLWGFEYASRINVIRGRQSVRGEHWRDNSVMLDQGRVVLSPWDSDELFCLDLLTGESRWDRKVPRGAGIFVAAVHEDQIVVAGKSELTSLSIADAKLVWKCPLGGAPAGRGIHTGATYMIATTESELLQVSLATGEVVDKMETDGPLGNLIASDDMIISQNGAMVRTFYQRGKLEPRVDSILAENPNDSWALEQQGYLLLERGQRLEGMRKLLKSIENTPAEPQGMDYLARERLLDETFAMLLEEQDPESLDFALKVEPLIPTRRRQEYLRVMTVRNGKEGRIREAFEANLKLYLVSLQRSSGVIVEPNMMQLPQRSVRADRWHRSMFRKLWNQADSDERTDIQATIHAALTSARKRQREELLTALQDVPAMHPEYLEMLKTQVVRNTKIPYVEGSLIRLSRSEDSALAGRATAVLGHLYRKSGQMVAAAKQFRRLRDEFGDANIDGQTGKGIAAAASADNATLRRYLQPQGEWSYGRVKSTRTKAETLTRSAIGYRRMSLGADGVGPLDSSHGESSLSNAQFVWVRTTEGLQLELRDSIGQTVRTVGSAFRRSGRGREPMVRSYGHLIAAASQNKVVCLNGLRDSADNMVAELWEKEGGVPATVAVASQVRNLAFGQLGISRRVQSGMNGRSQISLGPVSDRGIVARRAGELICWDPETGEVLWKRGDIRIEAEVWGDDEFVFVHVPARYPNGGGNARVFSVFDGEELESRFTPDQPNRVRTYGQYVLTWKRDIGQPLDLNLDQEPVVEDILKAKDPTLPKPQERASSNGFAHRIELRDLFKRGQAFEWSRSYTDLARAVWLSHSELGVYDPGTRKLEVISVPNGRIVFETEIETDLARVDFLKIEKRADLFVVILGRQTDGRVGKQIKYRSPIAAQPLRELETYAFSSDGQMVWGVPAKLMQFLPLVTLAPEVPLLLFARIEEASGGRAKRRFDAVALDVRDGHLAFSDNGTYVGNSALKLAGQPGETQAELVLPAQNSKWTLEFTDEPRAPALPFGYTPKPPAKIKSLPKSLDDLFGGS